MRVLIVCDMKSADSREKIRKILSDYGLPRGRDAFECDLNEGTYKILRQYLSSIETRGADAIWIYHIRAPCRDNISVYGNNERVLDDSEWVVI